MTREEFEWVVARAAVGDEGALHELAEGDLAYIHALAVSATSKTITPLDALAKIWPEAPS
jgi:hypothetical protein